VLLINCILFPSIYSSISAQKNLKLLSEQGHFLKGSSAALGVKKVQDSCENIQHYGKLWDEVAGVPITSEEALKRIGALLVVVKADFEQAEKWLKNWFRNNSSVQVD
jgi:osomolarity two-component system, phosphorelay intermediate protein YPD1